MKTILLSCLLVLAVPALAADPAIEMAIAGPERTAADRERDARDKPAEVMAFAGVKPGMTVADIFSAGGYYTELLAGVVGPGGKVLAINNMSYANFAKDDIKARFTEGRLKNVERRLVEASYMNPGPKSVDLAVIVMAYHDVYWIGEKDGWPEINTDGFIAAHRRSQCRGRYRQGNGEQAASAERGLGAQEPGSARLRVREVLRRAAQQERSARQDGV